MREVATSTNNKFYFWLCIGNGKEFNSEEYDNKIDCIKEFCDAMKTKKGIWGQFICHHYADQWQNEISEVIFTLSNNDVK